MNTFYLGTHQVNWIKETNVPLMISISRTKYIKSLYPSICDVMIDSIGFTMLSSYGKWLISEDEYIEECTRINDAFKRVILFSPQDWMCEPFIVEKTGLSVLEHQIKTVDNYISLSKKSKLPFLPVLQGYTLTEYKRCLSMYRANGIDTNHFGLGSVCRRQSTDEIKEIVEYFFNEGLKLHAYGVKLKGLQLYGHMLDSADSLAWSLDARYKKPLPECSHTNCANCIRYALKWRDRYINGT